MTSFNEIKGFKTEYSIVPVVQEIFADDITPINLLRKIAGISGRYFLLESVENGQKWGRYSFLGFDPVMRVYCKNGLFTVENGKSVQYETADPLAELRKILAGFKAPKINGMPPFSGGFVGYFGYGMIGYAEPVLKLRTADVNDFDLMLFDKVIAYDHLKQSISIIANIKTDALEENYQKGKQEIEKIIEIIKNAPMTKERSDQQPEFKCNVTAREYTAMVNRTKQYIVDGDIFQAVISRKFESPYSQSLINAYRVLRTTNPSPYMVFMDIDGIQIMSTSPETLVRLQEGRLTTFPVAGSRPRGATKEADEMLERELLSDEKELSEHNMLVDLGRNDLGKISKTGSVKVADYMMIHRYSKIMHITSKVESDIREDRDALDAIAAVLPAGTLSGAPKIRACQIINEQENSARGIYGGALGYLDFTGNMDTCIAIRMAVKAGGKVTVQAGGGIVADSIPEREYEESANKAKAVIDAIINARQVEDK